MKRLQCGETFFQIPKFGLLLVLAVGNQSRHSAEYDRGVSARRTNSVKQAILATVVSVKALCSDSVAVRLESDELNEVTTILATGLDCERDFTKSPGPVLEVTCEGDPRAEIGDKVPVIVSV